MRGPETMFNKDKKFDLDLEKGERSEGCLAELLLAGGGKIEIKSERWQWQQTGNIAIEYQHNCLPSGIAATQADYWAHMLYNGSEDLLMIMITPVPVLKKLCRQYLGTRFDVQGGDGGRSRMILLPLNKIADHIEVM